jgi:competence protein ComEC
MAACLTLLMPVGVPGRIIGIIWLLPIILINPPVPRNGEFWLGVLDVGQGLSVVVQTKNHVLLFDAGPRMGGYDAGESVVLPYLHAIGVRGIDKMIISHGDNDHIGGADVVLHTLPVSEILTSAVTKFPKNLANLCLSGKSWNWDGVNFSILYPYPESLALGNDSSCVLKIENGLHSALLTGDIEKFGENQLLNTPNSNLHAELLIVPHHGSKTSSQQGFIAAVAPSYAVFATGYRNRYRFPHTSVVRNYSEAGVMMLNTVESGALIFKVSQTNKLLQPISWRSDHDHYWNDHG